MSNLCTIGGIDDWQSFLARGIGAPLIEPDGCRGKNEGTISGMNFEPTLAKPVQRELAQDEAKQTQE